MEAARKAHYATAKKAGRKATKFDVKVVAKALDDLTDPTNLVGYTLIPPNMMPRDGGGRGIFHPVDALDAAGFRGAAQGVLVARATYDANHCVHPVSVSHMLAAEGDMSVGAHIQAELILLGEQVMTNPEH